MAADNRSAKIPQPGEWALVTGGAGFIGHHIARALLTKGFKVRVIDDFSNGQRTLVEQLKKDGGENFEFIEGSLLDADKLKRAVQGTALIYHEAALAGVPQSVEFPVQYNEVDATGTLLVLEAARAAGTKRVIYAGSSSVYGEAPELPKRENQLACPISPYGVAKHVGELYLSVYAQTYGMETMSLRYFNVFGPHQDPKSQYGAAIPAIVSLIAQGKNPTIYGDGEQTRDFCFIDNVVEANLLAGLSPKKLGGQFVNIACAQRTSVNDIVRLAARMLGKSVKPTHAPPRPGDVRDSFADISLAKSLLGYEPKVFFEEGLRRWIEWYKSAHLK